MTWSVIFVTKNKIFKFVEIVEITTFPQQFTHLLEYRLGQKGILGHLDIRTTVGIFSYVCFMNTIKEDNVYRTISLMCVLNIYLRVCKPTTDQTLKNNKLLQKTLAFIDPLPLYHPPMLYAFCTCVSKSRTPIP